MNTDDYAILIGIGRYPELGEDGNPADLQGPMNDVDAVKAWLLDPKGGGIPDEKNILVIKSKSDTLHADARPTADELETEFARLEGIAVSNGNSRVGRRIYIYMSGHGFSPARQRACLFAANASKRLSFNVHATGWLSWLQDSGYFSEFVLWMDSCMNRLSFLPPRDPPLPLRTTGNPPRANFVAFAAQRPLKAVEIPIPEDGGKTHGVFTWALLEGLRGAAADATGKVTGRSLADWLRNAQVANMRPQDLEDLEVAKEPEVIHEDAGLIFSRGVTKPGYEIRLTIPTASVGDNVRLWTGSPPRIFKSFSYTGSQVNLSLQPGLYLIELPTANLRQGFEVLKQGEIVVDENGTPVIESSAGTIFELEIDPGDPTAEIFIIDSQFALADANPARLVTPLPFGLYKIKTRIGRTTTQRVILLDRDRPPIERRTIVSPSATIVPIPGTMASHEYQRSGQVEAVKLANALGTTTDRAVLMIMVRSFSGPSAPVPDTQPWEGVTVVDSSGKKVLDLAEEGRSENGGDPYGFGVKEVDPGCYYLRLQLADGTRLEQSLVACKSWRLEAYVLRRVLPGESPESPEATRPRVSVMMRRLGDGTGSEEEDRMIEMARIALADERKILNPELETLLMRKFENPMAGIIGGHLLLVERERDPGRDTSLLDTVVRNLHTLVGRNHPDVAALALQCDDTKLRRAVQTLVGPPMLQRSWRYLVQAAHKRQRLIPVEMWERVQALTALPPFLAWSVDKAVRLASRTDLSRAILSESEETTKIPTKPSAIFQPIALSIPQPGGLQGFIRTGGTSARSTSATKPRDLPRDAKARAARLGYPPSALEALQADIS